MLADLLGMQPPPEPKQPIDPELAGKTLPEKFDRAITRHIQMHGNYAPDTAIPQAGYFQPEPPRYRPGYFREIFRFVSGLSNGEE